MIRARAVGNAVFIETPGGAGNLMAWGEADLGAAKHAAEQVNAVIDLVVRYFTVNEVRAHFSPEREPTTNERHLLNLLSWREKEAGELRKLLAEADAAICRMDAMRDVLAEIVTQQGAACRYDHNGFCQEHYSSRPCRIERAVAALKDAAKGGAD